MDRTVGVIGAGIIGTLTAYALLKRGFQVTLIDRDPPGEGCSFGNGGYIATNEILPLANRGNLLKVPRMLASPTAPLAIHWPSFPGLIPWFLRYAAASRKAKFEQGIEALANILGASQPAWQKVAEESGLEYLFRADGALRLHERARDAKAYAEELSLQRKFGVNAEDWDNARIRERLPGIRGDIHSATYYPDLSHTVDPGGLTKAVADKFAGAGGVFRRTEIKRLDPVEGGGWGATQKGRRHAFDQIVVAAGVETKTLLQHIGVKLPLVAERGYHAVLDPTPYPIDLPLGSSERGFIITPMSGGLRLAGTVEFAADDAAPSWKRAAVLVRHLKALFPEIQPDVKSRWMGRRPTLPDYLPAIGSFAKKPDLFVATGHQHLGLTLAAVSANMIADLVAGEAPAIDHTPFTPDRFS